MVKAETLVVGNKVKKVGGEKQAAAKKENKYEKLVNKKRKLNDTENKENSSEPSIKAKKPRVDETQKKPLKKKQNETDGKVKKEKNGEKKKATFSPATGKKLSVKKNGTGGKKTEQNTQPLSKKEQKDLKIKRKQKKLADNYSLSINIKKIWETLRKSETTEETRQKLCSSVYEQVKGKINQLAFAHDTCRVIECLIQYGNDKHRIGIFDELKMDIVKMAKCKYARFVLKKMLSYGSKEQKNAIVKSFSGKVTKLIKHSYACQLVEAIFNEHASFSQRNQMLMEFYDPTLAILVDQSNTKSLADILATNEVSKEKIMANLKGILSSCIDKTLLMFSIIHRVFLEYLNNCSAEERSDMIEVLSEQLVHMVHTRDGAQVAMECIWHSTAKQRKKIIKGMKSFITKVALEEQGHLVLLAIFDSVDDTKLVQKGILEEMFRSIGDLFGNEYGRKVITYLVVARDTRFFLKDYSKRLEKGDASETSKKDPEKRRAELFEYSSPFLVDYIRKELKSLLYNGAVGILVPSILQRLGAKANELIQAIANLILESPYEPEKPATATVKLHLIEDATSHFVIRKILQINKDAKQDEKSLSLSHALLSHSNVKNILSWIDCNRGCFILVNLIETSDESDKKRAISLIKEVAKDLDLTKPGAKLLNEKLK